MVRQKGLVFKFIYQLLNAKDKFTLSLKIEILVNLATSINKPRKVGIEMFSFN